MEPQAKRSTRGAPERPPHVLVANRIGRNYVNKDERTQEDQNEELGAIS